ncbi:FCSD flavin-binding domain-containing protein [Methylomonas sp. MS20]|uniref:FCSD flavin-binding domain-containing protein n=1 Tax=Methylomonas sp. MS20 TaxID=3418769 RepID=UPI003CFFB09F
MADWSRRRFLRTGAVATAGSLSACQTWTIGGAARAHVVVVGGGFAGATAAKFLRVFDPTIDVTLIEPKSAYITCPASNWTLAGLLKPAQLQVDYRALVDHYQVRLIGDRVAAIDADRRKLVLADGDSLRYDRLVLAPGIDFDWQAIAGYDAEMAERFPHAWQAGPQTELLLRQIQAMPDGGRVLICAPPDPYRCPPGPYERASLIAFWLKQFKPRAKVVILDPKPSFSKQKLFESGWRRHFGYGTPAASIEWLSIANNPVVRLEAAGRAVLTDFGDRFTGDVLNIIPPQRAGRIAAQAGLTDSGGWCPVDPWTSRSRFNEFIHVIGDAADYAPIPKSAFAANSEAKVCARAVVDLLNGRPPTEPHWLNTCYSLIVPDHGISVAMVYGLNAGRIAPVPGAGGVSADSPAAAALEAGYAVAAYRNLRKDSFE